MSKNKNERPTQALRVTPSAPLLGRIEATVGDLINERNGFAFDQHARTDSGALHKPQAEKLAANIAYTKRHGWNRTRVLKARYVGDNVVLLEGFHMSHALAQVLGEATVIDIDIIEATDAEALSIASYSNAEGQGFSMLGSLQQIMAIIRYLCGALTSPAARLALGIAVLKPRTKLAYTMDNSSEARNPYSAHQKRDTWTHRDISAEDVATFAAVGPKTAERLMKILSGLRLMDMQPSALAGMTYDQAQRAADACRAFRKQIGEEPITATHRKNLRAVFDAIRKGQEVHYTNAEGAKVLADSPARLATAAIVEEKIAATDKKKRTGPLTKRSTGDRILDDIAKVADWIAEDEDRTVTPAENERIQKAITNLSMLTTQRTAEPVAETEEDDAPTFDTDEKIAAENARLKNAASA